MRTRRRWLWLPGIAALAAVAGIAVFQDRLIYQPPRIRAAAVAEARKVGRDVRSTISVDGRPLPQLSFFVPASRRLPAPGLWILFHGNGSLATDWLVLVRELQLATHGGVDLLLVEYPGYGLSGGKPSPQTIQAAGEAAFAALARMLKESPEDLCHRTSVLGISLGCAAALQFASKHSVQDIVLAAPFTSLSDMARRHAGWPLCRLLRSDFDNRACLREALARRPAPKVTIVHGARDIIVPQWMGRELARSNKSIRFVSLPGAGHEDIPREGPDGLVALMTGR